MADGVPTMQNTMSTAAPTPADTMQDPTQQQQQQPAEPFPPQQAAAADSPAPPLMNIHADIDMADAAVKQLFRIGPTPYHSNIFALPLAVARSAPPRNYTYDSTTTTTKDSDPGPKHRWQ